MPNLYNYRLFISHAWKYGPDYIRLVNLLDNASYFHTIIILHLEKNLFFLLVHLTHLQILQIK